MNAMVLIQNRYLRSPVLPIGSMLGLDHRRLVLQPNNHQSPLELDQLICYSKKPIRRTLKRTNLHLSRLERFVLLLDISTMFVRTSLGKLVRPIR